MEVEIERIIQRVDQTEDGCEQEIDRERLLDAQCGDGEAKQGVGQRAGEEEREIGQHENDHLPIEKMRSPLVWNRLTDGLNSVASTTSVDGNASQTEHHGARRENSDGENGHNRPNLLEEVNIRRVLLAGSTDACHSSLFVTK